MPKTVSSIISTSNMINLCAMATLTVVYAPQRMIMNLWANTMNLTLINLRNVAIVLIKLN